MKALSTSVIFLLLLIVGCKSENEDLKTFKKGEVSFSLELIGESAATRESFNLPTGSYLQISIETAEGTEVLAQDSIAILTFNGTFVSAPLELNEAAYLLTEFMVLSPGNEVLYATPVSGSPMADLTNDPLPFPFEVVANEATSLSLEVLNVSMLTPEDIGYVSFPFTIVNHFFVSVFELEENGQTLTDAQGYIIQESDTVKEFSVEPEINAVTFSGNDTVEFTLVIVKDGFAKHTQNFTIKDIYDDYDNAIVPVSLIPALTFVAVPGNYDNATYPDEFGFSLTYQGNITIDWGDGTVEEGSFVSNYWASHNYESFGEYFVSVTGDLATFTEFYSYYGQGPMKAINLYHLPELDDLRIGFNGSGECPKVIDLSRNHKVRTLNLALNHDLEEIIIPELNQVLHLLIQGPNNISTANLENIIAPIYESVVATGRTGGAINLGSEEEFGETAGPPSESDWAKLRILKNEYDWFVYPDPDSEKASFF
ncbi:hypothetical protein JKA74_14105 [Marivirga sp. S37H4]|uniref:PKD domain-containing protein n=1 Tax=Marivirga aurantiaca TaxID=2802615 RepID=A0A934WZP1_9BACT|nr:hypothetical protein [Marivirga aurantiaca]MBK6266174.1 hypothetical protein [Marivirga aurantiaca]